ncbi:interleukin-1 receptor-associated kinase-like 2 isoform X1 [Scyliorhinus canicula]|uniref:interleukin-1 receptor-associated kinase-like 2 isoform X1 n=2 Tax=Scyliorhinus canicula TaxID=7830 RepID=UPI0018F3C219|nr:interleukin-1 receptor-associated kinase-like 2 isoform X1 [Scyliorhinus canicula]
MTSQHFVYDIPANIMEEFNLVMDTLAPGLWHRFGSQIIADQTELRKIESLGGNYNSRTRELMWAWGMKQATVQQLLHILNEMQLYRAIHIILSWQPAASSIAQPTSMQSYLPETSEMFRPPLPTANPVLNCENNMDSSNNVRQLDPLPGPSIPPSHLNSTYKSDYDKCDMPSPEMDEVGSRHLQETNDHPAMLSCIWSLQDLEQATDNFNEMCQIGSGTFGHVYKGHRFNTEYAIKLLKVDNVNLKITRDYFHREVETLYKFRHSNILPLEGCCGENGVYCLIYRYMSNGSLESKLQCKNPADAISWNKRINIAVGIARAIQFLHRNNVPLIHGNIKSSNILLDEYFTPKLGDFGLVKIGPLGGNMNPINSHTTLKTKALQGSLAYLPDEFIRFRWLSVKVDTFSFGIVLAEILTGFKAVDESRKPIFLKDLVLGELETEKPTKTAVDLEKTAYNICQNYLDTKGGPLLLRFAVRFAVITCQCIKKKRLEMKEVYSMLESLEHQVKSQDVQENMHNCPEEVEDISCKLNQLALCPQENTEVHYSLLAPKYCIKSSQSQDSSNFRGLPESSLQLLDAKLPNIPCESDESEYFCHDPVPASHGQSSCEMCNIKSKCVCSDSSSWSQGTEGSSMCTNTDNRKACQETVEKSSNFVQELSSARSHVSDKLCTPFDYSDAAPNGAWEFHPDSKDETVNPNNYKEASDTDPARKLCCYNPGDSLLQDRLNINSESENSKFPSWCASCQSLHENEPYGGATCALKHPTSSAGCQLGVPESTSPEMLTASSIKINPHKKKLLAKILLYEEDRIDSAELLSAPSLPDEE